MPEHGDDAGHCRNGLSVQNYREASAEERATYRRWGVGIAVFYSALLLIFGIVAIANDSGDSRTKLTSLSAHSTAASARSN